MNGSMILLTWISKPWSFCLSGGDVPVQAFEVDQGGGRRAGPRSGLMSEAIMSISDPLPVLPDGSIISKTPRPN